MIWNNHSKEVPEGAHAFLGASKHSWINYDTEKLILTYKNFLATQHGTVLHNFASTCINLKQKLPKSKKTLNMFVNDALGFGMRSEQPLFYSPNCFGTADAIIFDRDFLRIHDLKTGVTPASFHQLEIYAAMFCLEYNKDPHKIQMELRIYQSDDILVEIPSPDDIKAIMEKIIIFDKEIRKLQEVDNEL